MIDLFFFFFFFSSRRRHTRSDRDWSSDVCSSDLGGGVLLPGSVVQATPQLGVVGSSPKPLKLRGAEPPLVGLSFAHCAPQKVTALPVAAFLSPMTKLPPPGAKANPTVLQELVAVLPPTSWMVVVMVKMPVVAYVCAPLTMYAPPAVTATTPVEHTWSAARTHIPRPASSPSRPPSMT